MVILFTTDFASSTLAVVLAALGLLVAVLDLLLAALGALLRRYSAFMAPPWGLPDSIWGATTQKQSRSLADRAAIR